MKTMAKSKHALLIAALLGSTAMLAGCSGDDSAEAPAAKSEPAQQSTAAVKQPEPAPAPKPAPAPAPVQEAVKQVEQKVEAAKEEVAQAAAGVSGEKAYSTCVGCHGANGEGGVGPRLNNQTVDDIVTKLEKYKAGEQIGPMTGMMAPMAAPLTTEQMKAIGEYITSK